HSSPSKVCDKTREYRPSNDVLFVTLRITQQSPYGDYSRTPDLSYDFRGRILCRATSTAISEFARIGEVYHLSILECVELLVGQLRPGHACVPGLLLRDLDGFQQHHLVSSRLSVVVFPLSDFFELHRASSQANRILSSVLPTSDGPPRAGACITDLFSI